LRKLSFTSRPELSSVARVRGNRKAGRFVEKTGREVIISIQIRQPELNAQLQKPKNCAAARKSVSRFADERRWKNRNVSARKASKVMAQTASRREIARTEWSLEGRLPLHASRGCRLRFCRSVDDVRNYRRQSLDLSRRHSGPNASMAHERH